MLPSEMTSSRIISSNRGIIYTAHIDASLFYSHAELVMSMALILAPELSCLYTGLTLLKGKSIYSLCFAILHV